jgi:DNA-binding response OmpR family regulator
METVLIVEDSRPMQRILKRLFEEDSIEVRIAGDGISALEIFQEQTPSAVTLDLTIPRLSGKEVCRALKTHRPSVPVVVVSVDPTVERKVLMLELGADDYVTKPFDPKELLARVRRAIRRAAAGQRVISSLRPNEIDHDVFSFGDVRIDFTSMTATCGGKPIPITTQELKLLRFFAHSPERVFTRNELLHNVWGYESYPSTRTVDNHILHLRQKLEPDPTHPRFFLTMHGTGYRFVVSSNSDEVKQLGESPCSNESCQRKSSRLLHTNDIHLTSV